MVRISVVVPVHNTEKYLRQCVGSILGQTLDGIEVILVENASSDGSLAVCRELAAEYSNVRCVTSPIGDPSTARNIGVRMATGDYIGFVDSDDTIAGDMYERMYNAARRYDAEFVNCNYVKVYRHRKPKYQYSEDGRELLLTPKEMVTMNLMEKVPQSLCTILVRKSLAQKIMLPENVLFEDRATTYHFAAAADRCVQIDKSLYFYHQYRGNIVSGSKKFRQSYFIAEADLRRMEFIRNSGMYQEDEMGEVSTKSAESFFRKINRMRKAASTVGEKEKMRSVMRNACIFPSDCRLSIKARIIRWFVLRAIASSQANGR